MSHSPGAISMSESAMLDTGLGNLECKDCNLEKACKMFQTGWYFDYFIRSIENIH